MDGRVDSGDDESAAGLIYDANPKHKPVPSPGRHGSLCPRDADGPGLLKASDPHGGQRYATDGVGAFCAQQHRPGFWHGYPVLWDEVPPKLVARWVSEGRVTRSTIRRERRRNRR